MGKYAMRKIWRKYICPECGTTKYVVFGTGPPRCSGSNSPQDGDFHIFSYEMELIQEENGKRNDN